MNFTGSGELWEGWKGEHKSSDASNKIGNIEKVLTGKVCLCVVCKWIFPGHCFHEFFLP